MDLETALLSAIAFEYRVRDHYVESARRVTDPRGQRVFTTLAREEQGHADYLAITLAHWKANGTLPLDEFSERQPGADWIRDAAVRITARNLPMAASHELPELACLKQALVLERQTSAFYMDLVNGLEPGQRMVFARFLDIEDGHAAMLQSEIEALEGAGNWQDVSGA